MKHPIKKLFGSLVIDAIGMISYIIPGIGEIFDLIWSPISAFLIYRMYGNAFFSVIGFVEEAAPGFDFIPTATIAWLYERFK